MAKKKDSPKAEVQREPETTSKVAPEASQPPAEVIEPSLPMVARSGNLQAQSEMEALMLMAHRFPRNPDAIAKDALAELDLMPEFAKTAYYSIPYNDGFGGVTMVEGPSIKAAMTLARRWGLGSNGARIVEDEDERVIVEGVFIDYQTGMRTVRQVSVPKKQWSKKQSRFIQLAPDRLNLAIEAGKSKAVRNAILASLPAAIVQAYYNKAREVVARTAGESKQKALASLCSELVRLGATREQVSKLCEQPAFKGRSMDHLISNLKGLINALEEKQVTLDEVIQRGGVQKKETVAGPVKANELI